MSEDVPAVQIVQFTERADARLPAKQAVQLVAARALPVADPAEHGMQPSVTAVGAYLPLLHSSQLDMLNTYVPPGQMVQSAPSAALNVPPGHSSQSEAASWCVASVLAESLLNVPIGHRLQDVRPDETAMWPAAHTAHAAVPVEAA